MNEPLLLRISILHQTHIKSLRISQTAHPFNPNFFVIIKFEASIKPYPYLILGKIRMESEKKECIRFFHKNEIKSNVVLSLLYINVTPKSVSTSIKVTIKQCKE